jgi:hypothetical protein
LEPWLTWFCIWQADRVLPVDAQDINALRRLLARCPGLDSAQVLVPTAAHDPYYPTPAGSPSLIVQLYVEKLDVLEAHLRPEGPLAPLAVRTFLPSLADARAAHQAMLVRFYPVADPSLRSASPLSYWVEYEGPAEDANAWHGYYNANHPPLLAQLPGIRGIEIYTPATIVCGLPLPERGCLQRNKTVFESAEAMRDAMCSPVREALRDDFRGLPPFEGPAHHFPFLSLACRPSSAEQP